MGNRPSMPFCFTLRLVGPGRDFLLLPFDSFTAMSLCIVPCSERAGPFFGERAERSEGNEEFPNLLNGCQARASILGTRL
jgi:hypothetical protein